MTLAPITAFDADAAALFLQLLGKPPAQSWFRSIAPGRGANRSRNGADLHGFHPQALQADSTAGDNLYLVIGNANAASGKSGGITDADITSMPALFVEWDDRPQHEQLQAWQQLGLPEPSLMVTTGGKSIHCYWLLQQPISPAEWKAITARLIEHCGSDRACSNPSRVMRLPGTAYRDKKSGAVTGHAAILHTAEHRYTVSEIEACLPGAAAPLLVANNVVPTLATTDLPPRSLEAIREAASFIPERVVGGNTYETCRRALCGCAAALAEIGLPESMAVELLGGKWPDRKTAEQALNSSTTRNAATFWAIAQEHGFTLSRRPTASGPDGHGAAIQLVHHGRRPAEPEQCEPEPLGYTETLDAVLDAIRARDDNREMVLRAELKNRFRISDEQIASALFNRYSQSKVKPVTASHDSVDMGGVESLDYLMDGWIPRGDLCLTYGPYGSGKTTLALYKAYSYAKGKNILDRSAPCDPGKVLIIATDSGAAALKKTFQDLGIDPDTDPIFKPGHPDQRIWIWAYEPSQGHSAWLCDLHGVIRLEEHIKRHGISYVVIDSAKSVSAGAGWSYVCNESVKALMRHMREGICQPTGACIEFLSHEGGEKGAHSGAKAWGEDPSMVCSLSVATTPDGRPAGITVAFRKDRAAVIDPRRQLTYDLNDDGLAVRAEVEVVGNCEEAILSVLWEAHQRGVEALPRAALIEELWAKHKLSQSTVDNTLSRAGSGKGNKPTRLIRPQRGVYALSPREIQHRSSSPNREGGEMGGNKARSIAAEGEWQVPNEVPEGTSRELPDFPPSSQGNPLGTCQTPVTASDLPDQVPNGEIGGSAEAPAPCPDDGMDGWEPVRVEPIRGGSGEMVIGLVVGDRIRRGPGRRAEIYAGRSAAGYSTDRATYSSLRGWEVFRPPAQQQAAAA